mgnify:FL=1
MLCYFGEQSLGEGLQPKYFYFRLQNSPFTFDLLSTPSLPAVIFLFALSKIACSQCNFT